MGFSTKVPVSWPGSGWFREVAYFGTSKNILSLPLKCLVPGLVQGGSDSFIWTSCFTSSTSASGLYFVLRLEVLCFAFVQLALRAFMFFLVSYS